MKLLAIALPLVTLLLLGCPEIVVVNPPDTGLSEDATAEVTDDAASEITADTTPEVSPDTTPEVSPDTTPEVSPDTTPEVGPDTISDGDGTETDATTTDDGASPDDVPDTDALPDNGPDVPVNDCGTRECGLSPSGINCGMCDGAEICNAQGQCLIPATANGAYCGATTTCPFLVDDPAAPGEQMINPNWPACVNSQCQSNFCFDVNGTTYSSAPVCSKQCEITTDVVNNATGAANPDGVQDAGGVNPCAGFEDGPNGAEFHCVSYSPLGPGSAVAYCTPGTAFAECKSSKNCAAGEMCAMSSIGGVIGERCITAVTSGDWGVAVNGGDDCNERDPFKDGGLKLCGQGGLCFGFGCASYCDPVTQAGCNTTEWQADTGCDTAAGKCKASPNISCTENFHCSWLECGLLDQTVFSNFAYTGDFCYPKGCDTDNDCFTGMYCRFSYNGGTDADGLPVWENICLPEAEGGVALGAECDTDPDDNSPGDTCLNEDMCFGGYCSKICNVTADCATGQFCHVMEFTVPDATTPAGQQSLPMEACVSYPGTQTPCLSQAECATGESCQHYTYLNDDASTYADGPLFADGYCVVSEGTGALGANCGVSSDCAGGWCLGADAEANIQGFCTQSCAASSECPAVDDGNGATLTGICTNQFTGYGTDSREIGFRIYSPVCQYTEASAADCSYKTGTDGVCAATEYCGAIIIASGPNHAAVTEYLCLDNTNVEGDPAPFVALGGECDSLLENADGIPIGQCLSGICFQDKADGKGYCSKVCDPAADSCAPDTGIPTTVCEPIVSVVRNGAFADNSGTWNACRKNENCSPCLTSESCPGDRVCVNLGADADTLSDYRCVPACADASDCTDGDAPAICTAGKDGFGKAVMGCFDAGTTTPVNFCIAN